MKVFYMLTVFLADGSNKKALALTSAQVESLTATLMSKDTVDFVKVKAVSVSGYACYNVYRNLDGEVTRGEAYHAKHMSLDLGYRFTLAQRLEHHQETIRLTA